jgi:hypothetical protein
MNQQSDTITSTHTERSTGTAAVPDGYLLLLTTPDMFSMDLVGKNLQMNGIHTVWSVPDPVDMPGVPCSLFVRTEQKEQALSILTSLDLIDFTTTHGQ